MRGAAVIAAIVTLSCGRAEIPAEPKPATTSFSVRELEFNDDELDAIARSLIAKAHAVGIHSVSAPNRLQALLVLEGLVGHTSRGLDRFNWLATKATSADQSPWAKLRTDARREFAGRNDPIAMRVNELLSDWEKEKLRTVERDVSDPKREWVYWAGGWERSFHEFVRDKPRYAPAWGWLVLRALKDDVQQQYGRADLEHAYRYYVELTGLGTERESRDLFSVWGATEFP